MNTIMSALHGIADGIGPFLILLGLLIFVHELGHFLVAKFFGVRVEVFSLGFGRKILQFKRGDTTYCVSLIPLGGYVKMFGDDPSKEIPPSEQSVSFLHKPVGPRFAIVLAGPIMNLIFAFFIFVILGLTGEPAPGNFVGDIQPGTRAYDAGFRSGDRVLKIDGKDIESWTEVREVVAKSTDKKLNFVVEREDSKEQAEVQITPVLGENDNILSKESQIGVIPGLEVNSFASIIGVTGPETLAAQAGLRNLDLILSVNDKDLLTWRDLNRVVKEEFKSGQRSLKLVVENYSDDKPEKRELSLSLPESATDGEIQLSMLGIEPGELYLWKVKRDSPAFTAGLEPGDRLTKIGGEEITRWSQVIDSIKAYNPDLPAPEVTFRRNGEEKTVTIRPEPTELIDARGRDEKRYTIGIVSGFIPTAPRTVIVRAHSFGDALSLGVTRTWETSGMIIMSLVRLVQGDVSAKNIGGIISIGRVANQSYEAGLPYFLRMMALISINLFLLNLLPVPVLDGGHLVFFSIEALRGAPLSMRKMEIAQQVGLVILMSLMAFALFNDISNWLNSIW